MKNLITYPTSQNRLASLAGVQSRFNEIIDLEPIQSFIAYLAAKFKRVFDTDDDDSELWRLCRLKSKETRKLRNAKVHNFKTSLKWAMLRRPIWRNKVLADLGGDEALAAWETKAAKAEARALNPKPYTAPKYKRPPLASLRLGAIKLPPIRTAFDVKTDKSGAFRLAPIPNARPKRPDGFEPPELTETQKWERKEGWRLRTELRYRQHEPIDESTLKGYWHKDEFNNVIYRMKPIPLLPDELRGIGVEEEAEYETQPSLHLWEDVAGAPAEVDGEKDESMDDADDNAHVEGPD